MNPVKPMLAVSGQPFNSEGWIFEPKIDGTRCLAGVSSSGMRLHNRRLFDITYRYPELVIALALGASSCVLDGEITVFVDGKPSFAALAERDHQNERLRIDYLSRALPASYVVFDILYAKERSVMHLPLRERKQILRDELQESEIVTIADSFPEKGEDYFQAALKMGIEGIVAKRLDSRYEPGTRSQEWRASLLSWCRSLPWRSRRTATFAHRCSCAPEMTKSRKSAQYISSIDCKKLRAGVQPAP